MQEASKHRLFIESAIVPEAVFVQVSLQVVTANVVIYALDSVLDQRPKPFDGLRMNVASNIDFLAVPDAAMVVVVWGSGQSIVSRIVIRKNEIRWQDMLFNQAMQSVLLDIGSYECANAALALDNSDHWRLSFLVRCASSALHSLLTAKIHFVNLYGLLAATEFRSVLGFVQHGANLLEHPPCGFVGNARFPLNLFRGYAATGLRHEVDGIKPSGERSRRLVEDRASGRVNVMAAMVARVGRTAHNAMVLGYGFALLAIDAIRVEAIAKPFKASCVIRELALEVFQRVRQHFRLAVVVRHKEPTYV